MTHGCAGQQKTGKLSLFVGLVLALALLAPTAAATAAPGAHDAAAARTSTAQDEAQFVSLLNQLRASKGLSTLKVNTAMVTQSRTWSQHMGATDHLYHHPDLVGQMNAALPDWSRGGENVGYGPTVQRLHDAFYNSPHHRANMLGDYNQVGVGEVIVNGRIWVTVRFGKGSLPYSPPVRTTRVAAPPPAPRIIPDHLGVRRANQFLLRPALTAGAAMVNTAYGASTDVPITGDWTGTNHSTLGIFRSGTFMLRNYLTTGWPNAIFSFGRPGDIPVVGDWNGNGTDEVGVFRGGIFYLRFSRTDIRSVGFGRPGDVPVTGDWDRNGTDDLGLFRNGMFYLRTSPTAPVTAFSFGRGGDRPLAGDWDGDGRATVGIWRNGIFMLRNQNAAGAPAVQVQYGSATDTPVTGQW